MRSLAVVTTTIFVPEVVRRHVEIAEQTPELEVSVVVAGDLKTPPETEALCRELDGQGARVVYLSPPEQERRLADFPELAAALPWNSVQRRNVGLLVAYLDGADVLLTVDDDNFPLDDDYLRRHAIAGLDADVPEIRSPGRWVNVCDLLSEADGLRFFHRGFPLDRRWSDTELELHGPRRTHVVVNAGLWLGDPDVDALTRLYRPVDATGLSTPLESSAVLGDGFWSPFDSQNTSLAREALPGYFLSPDVGRYDDILASYLLLAIAHHLGDGVAFGLPLVRQDRNVHDLWRDFDLERLGYEVTPALVDALADLDLSGSDYRTCFAEIVDWLPGQVARSYARGDHRQALEAYVAGLEAWVRTFERLA